MEMNAENHISNHNISINYWTEEYLSKPPLYPSHLAKVFNHFNNRQKSIPCFRPFIRYPWHFPPEKSVLTGIYITIGCQLLHPKNSTHYPFVWGKFHCKHAIIYLAGTKCVAVAYVAGIAFSSVSQFSTLLSSELKQQWQRLSFIDISLINIL